MQLLTICELILVYLLYILVGEVDTSEIDQELLSSDYIDVPES